MKSFNELKVSTLKRKHREVLKKIEKAHEDGNYNKLDMLIPQRNEIEAVLESKDIFVLSRF